MHQKLKRIVILGIFAGISLLLVLAIRIPIFLDFLEYDPADIPIFIATFAFGPWWGLLLTVVVSVLQGITVSAGSGWIGIFMHILATGSFALVAGGLYQKKKTKGRAALALLLGTLLQAGIMVGLNLLLTPLFMGQPVETVLALLLPAILPFNLLKAGINSLVTFLIYKHIAKLIRVEAGSLQKTENPI